jgi:hypothetical protein
MATNKRTHPSPSYPSFPNGARAVVQSDTVNMETPCTVYVGGAGDVKVTTFNGDEVTFAMLAGGTVPVTVIRVWSTDTTATALVAVY